LRKRPQENKCSAAERLRNCRFGLSEPYFYTRTKKRDFAYADNFGENTCFGMIFYTTHMYVMKNCGIITVNTRTGA